MGEWTSEVVDVALASRNTTPEVDDVRLGAGIFDLVQEQTRILLFPPKHYTLLPAVGTRLVFPANVDLLFMPGATFNVPAGVTVDIQGCVHAEDMALFCAPAAYNRFTPSGPILPLYNPMGGTVRLLSPWQRKVYLSWWGAVPIPMGGFEFAEYVDASKALRAALECASVGRVRRYEDETTIVSSPRLRPTPAPLPSLEVVVNGGEYRITHPVVLNADPAVTARPRVILNGATGAGNAALARFRFTQANVAERLPDRYLLDVGAGIDVDLRNVHFITGTGIDGVFRASLRGTASSPARVRLSACLMEGGHESTIALREGSGNQGALVDIDRLILDARGPDATRVARAGLSLTARDKVLVRVTGSRWVSTDFGAASQALFRDECLIRLRGGSFFIREGFFHSGPGPWPMPAVNLAGSPQAREGNAGRERFAHAEGQDLFLEAPEPGAPWTQLTLLAMDSQGWSLLGSELSNDTRCIGRPTVFLAVTANNVNGYNKDDNTRYSHYRWRAELEREPQFGVEEALPALSPISVIWAGNTAPLVMSGCRLFGATAVHPNGRIVDAGVSYYPLGALVTRYIGLETVRQRSRASMRWPVDPPEVNRFAYLVVGPPLPDVHG